MKITLSDSRLLLTKAAHASPGIKKSKGSFLVETSISLFVLVAIAVVLVDSSINILQPRSWVMKQNLADAYLSKEVAEANRVDFSSIGDGSFGGWGTPSATGAGKDTISGNMVSTADVALGKLPGFTLGTGNGRNFTGDVTRQVTALQTNGADGAFTPATNGGKLTLANLGIRAYRLQSHVSYTIDGTVYVKTRTIIRSQ